jgi:hypothetical protein
MRMIWEQQVESMGKKKIHGGFWWGNWKEKDHLKETGTDGRIIFQW